MRFIRHIFGLFLILSLLISCFLFLIIFQKTNGKAFQVSLNFIAIGNNSKFNKVSKNSHVNQQQQHFKIPKHLEQKNKRQRIPKHLHQYWNGKFPPLNLMQQCRDLHPAWNYTLWTPESIRKLKPFYNRAIFDRFSTQQVNGQSDIVRYSVLREFGGIYLDADTLCLRPLDELLQNGFFAGYHSKNNTGTRENNKNHPNRDLVASAVMGCVPQHPLIVRLTESLNNTYKEGSAWSTVGPGHLTRTIKNCPDCNISGDIRILPFYAFVPYHHEENVILQKYIEDFWKLPKLRLYKPYAMNLWGTTFNQWHKLSKTKLSHKKVYRTDTLSKHSSITDSSATKLNLSIVIPATFVDLKVNLPELLHSISTQTIQNREIIIVITGIEHEKCSKFRQQNTTTISCHIFCFETLKHEAWARNFGVRQVSSEWVAFFDSDDLLFPNHNALLQHWIHCNPELRLILHGYTSKTHVERQKYKKIYGKSLFNAAKKLELQSSATPIFTSIMHSQAVSRLHDARTVLFREIPGEDSMWCRDIILKIGNHNKKMIADTSPLSWYIPRAGHQKQRFKRPKRLTSDISVQTYCDAPQLNNEKSKAQYLVFATCFGSMCRQYEPNFSTMQCYTAQYDDYVFVIIDLDKISDSVLQQDCSNTSPMFLRHCVFANYLAKYPQYKAALFIEADCAVFNYKIRFENFLKADSDMTMSIRFHNGEITAGIYVVRNVDFVQNFLKKWSTTNFVHNADNGALHRLILDLTGYTSSCQSNKSYEAFMKCFHQTIAKSKCKHGIFSKIVFQHPMDAMQYDGWLLKYRYSNQTFIQHAMKNPPITINGNDGYLVTNRLLDKCSIPRLDTHYISAKEEQIRLETKNSAKQTYRKTTMGFEDNSCLAKRFSAVSNMTVST